RDGDAAVGPLSGGAHADRDGPQRFSKLPGRRNRASISAAVVVGTPAVEISAVVEHDPCAVRIQVNATDVADVVLLLSTIRIAPPYEISADEVHEATRLEGSVAQDEHMHPIVRRQRIKLCSWGASADKVDHSH